MTTKEKIELIGKPARWVNYSRDGIALRFPITIDDVRDRFGRVDYLITPVGGEGQRWVESDSVEVDQ